jgi:hypothetical protein
MLSMDTLMSRSERMARQRCTRRIHNLHKALRYYFIICCGWDGMYSWSRSIRGSWVTRTHRSQTLSS